MGTCIEPEAAGPSLCWGKLGSWRLGEFASAEMGQQQIHGVF